MVMSSADDEELRRACEAAIEGTNQTIVLSIRVFKSRAIWTKFVRDRSKPRVLALCTISNGQRTEGFLRVLKQSTGRDLKRKKVYKLKHLSEVEVITNARSGCTLTLRFHNLRSKSVAPPQWIMHNIDDRSCLVNRILDILTKLDPPPNIVGSKRGFSISYR